MGWVIFRQIWKAVLLYAKGLGETFFTKKKHTLWKVRERLAKCLAEGQKRPIKFPRNKMVFSCFTLGKDLSPKFGSFHICRETKTWSNCFSVNYASLHTIYRTDHVFTRKTEIVLSCYTPKHVANHDPHISAGFPLFSWRNRFRGCILRRGKEIIPDLPWKQRVFSRTRYMYKHALCSLESIIDKWDTSWR